MSAIYKGARPSNVGTQKGFMFMSFVTPGDTGTYIKRGMNIWNEHAQKHV